MEQTTLAIVVPCFNEEEVLPQTNGQLRALLDAMMRDRLIGEESYILYVDDGSRDRTWSIIAGYGEGDAHVRGLGEQAFGCAHGMKDFIILALGFGLGSCCFSNGVPHLGYHGYAGEIGHTCIVEGGRKCDCGNLGCLEIYCAHKGIIKNAYDVLAESDEPSLMRDCEKLDPKIIADMCDKGDKLAIEVYRRAGSILGLGIANYTSVFNPEAIIFTGGISRAGKWLLEPCNEAFEKYVFHNVHGKVKILTSILEESDRDVLGASVLAWGMKEYSLFK
jgi:glucokinase